MLDHKRERKPAPENGPQKWSCPCGWSGEAENFDAAEKLFIEHIPENERRQCLLVDVYNPNPDDDDWVPKVLVLPVAEPALLKSHYESDDLRFGTIQTGETLPIYEVRTEQGQVFKAE